MGAKVLKYHSQVSILVGTDLVQVTDEVGHLPILVGQYSHVLPLFSTLQNYSNVSIAQDL
jgi:hypothetical protein